jgi:hypothetical protein
MSRKVADCRRFPSVSGCTLTLIGAEAEVVRAALEHSVSVHGHESGPELEQRVRESLEEEDEMPEARRPHEQAHVLL